MTAQNLVIQMNNLTKAYRSAADCRGVDLIDIHISEPVARIASKPLTESATDAKGDGCILESEIIDIQMPFQ